MLIRLPKQQTNVHSYVLWAIRNSDDTQNNTVKLFFYTKTLYLRGIVQLVCAFITPNPCKGNLVGIFWVA